MHASHGDLLIGGLRLANIQVDLEEEFPQPGTSEWRLTGRLHLSPEKEGMLQIDRPYRLQLEDGRAGQIVLRRIDRPQQDELLVGFQPRAAVEA